MTDTLTPAGSGVANPSGGTLPLANPNASMQAIPVDTLGTGNTTIPNLPSAPTPTDLSSHVASGNATIAGNTAGLTPPPTPDATTAPEATPSWYQKLLDSIKSTTGASTEASLSSGAGLDQKTADANAKAQTVLDKQAILTASQNSLNALNQQVQGFNFTDPLQNAKNATGVTGMVGINAANTKDSRDFAINITPKIFAQQAQVLSDQAAVATAQGNANLAQTILSQAQNHVDKLFQIKTIDAQNQYNYQKDIIDTYYQYADKQQQQALDAKKTADAQAFTTQQNAMNQAQTLANTAITNGQADLASKILALDPKSTTYQADVAKLASQIKAKNENVWSASYRDPVSGNIVQRNTTTGEIKNLDTTPNNSTGGNFTQTQLNKGAANAGVSITDFNGYDADTKNYFINNKGNIDAVKKSIDDAKSTGTYNGNTADATTIISDINASSAPQKVKDSLISYTNEKFPTTSSSGSGFEWWNPSTWLK